MKRPAVRWSTRPSRPGPARHPGQQRRHQHPQGAGVLHPEESAHAVHPDESHQHLRLVPRGASAHEAGGRRKIINIGSMLSIFGASFAAPYTASKGGVVPLTKSLATSWGRDNIQVNAVLPGSIETPLTVQARSSTSRDTTSACCRERPRAGGECLRTWPESPCSSPRAPRIRHRRSDSSRWRVIRAGLIPPPHAGQEHYRRSGGQEIRSFCFQTKTLLTSLYS